MTAIDDPADATLIDRILGEYREMPGLALTIDQAQRLWQCEADAARRLTDVLISRGVLQWSRDGRLILTVTPSNRFGSLSVYGSDALGIQDLMSTTPS